MELADSMNHETAIMQASTTTSIDTSCKNSVSALSTAEHKVMLDIFETLHTTATVHIL